MEACWRLYSERPWVGLALCVLKAVGVTVGVKGLVRKTPPSISLHLTGEYHVCQRLCTIQITRVDLYQSWHPICFFVFQLPCTGNPLSMIWPSSPTPAAALPLRAVVHQPCWMEEGRHWARTSSPHSCGGQCQAEGGSHCKQTQLILIKLNRWRGSKVA
jgi:hypothetical protein